tara:strand:+ start:169 stop:423 length:255 start_codon:yes stop_codon:yes gene_type:complete
MTDTQCATGGSDTQLQGLHQVTLNRKLEMEYDRLGVSTVTPNLIDCKVGSEHNMTSSMCKMKTPAHTLIFDAKFDRDMTASCDR